MVDSIFGGAAKKPKSKASKMPKKASKSKKASKPMGCKRGGHKQENNIDQFLQGGFKKVQGGKKYSDEDFANDLKELEQMIENYSGGFNDVEDSMVEQENMDMDVEGVNDVLDNNLSSNAGLFGGKSSSKKVKKVVKKEKKKSSSEEKKRYKVVSLDGKEVVIGKVSIEHHNTPLSAAKKLLRSIAAYKGLSGSNKTTMKAVVFKIKEITNGSSKKTYGPYIGKYKKYTADEIKKASYEIDGKVVKPSMKAIVKLQKHHVTSSLLKGGK